MIKMKNNTENKLMQYIMNTLMTNIELDADILSVACIMEGPLRKEDVVPEMMTDADWFAAKNYALSEGWIAKDPTGPSNRGARYVANDPTYQQMEEVNVFEEMGLSAFDYAADQHLMMVRSLFQATLALPSTLGICAEAETDPAQKPHGRMCEKTCCETLKLPKRATVEREPIRTSLTFGKLKNESWSWKLCFRA